MTFRDAVVLITGGSSGIGASCVQQFRARGARISVLDKVQPVGECSVVTVGDINDPDVRMRAVNRTLDTCGTIDVLISSVGIGLYEPASRSTATDELEVFQTNVFSAIGLTQLVIPHMKARRRGSIATISSVGAYVGLPWSAAYCASKAAIHSYSESLRRELHGYGIHVSTVVPGIVNTGFREHVIRGVAPDGVTSIRRSVSPEQVASCVVQSLVHRKRRIFIPWYGRIFTGMDFLFPGVMDAYIDRKWSVNDMRADTQTHRANVHIQEYEKPVK